jgi:glyoxalase family protein
LEYWEERLSRHNILVGGPNRRFKEKVLSFMSPDGLVLELIAHPEAEEYGGWKNGPIPTEYAIRGFHSVALMEAISGPTASLLTDVLGFKLLGQEGNRFRFKVGAENFATRVDVLNLPEMTRGRISVGSVHHIAWRTPGDEQQLVWRDNLTSLGIRVTPVMDRQYFHSIYFNEPGGVLFEIATDPPGFAIDEPQDQLGKHLKLPPWLESRRSFLEQSLRPLHLPNTQES